MFTTVCIAHSVEAGFKLAFFFGKNPTEAMLRALEARSMILKKNLLSDLNLDAEPSAGHVEILAECLSASLGANERWVAATNAREAVERLLLPKATC